jgi:GNAT superfamily N-acetyltransferase
MTKIEFAFYDKDNLRLHEGALLLLSEYFDELFADSPQDNIPKKYLPRILEEIDGEEKPYQIWMYISLKAGAPIGFGIAQIDSKENPWCKREGWGFIREFYIRPEHRRKGHARALLNAVEDVLRENGAQEIYLTTDSAQGTAFWEACGYEFFGEVCKENDGKILEKHGLVKTDA